MKKICLNIHNTNFEVISYHKDALTVINRIKDRYITHSYLYSKPPFKGAKPRVTIVPDKVYYSKAKKQDIFRFSIFILKDFMLTMAQYGLTRDEVEVNMDKTFDVASIDVKLKPIFTPKDYQHRYVEALIGKGSTNVSLIDLIMGYGKAQPLDANVRIKNNWRKMGDLLIHDELVMPDGSIGNVTGYYPQGKKRIYNVVFEDGRSTEVTGEHLWKIYFSEDEPVGTVVNTLKIIDLLRADHAKLIYIDLPEPALDEPEVFTRMPFYEIGIMCADDLISDVPKHCFNGNYKQRLDVLQGIFGKIKSGYNGSCITASFKNKYLTTSVVTLARSVGDIVYLEDSYNIKIYSSEPHKYFKDKPAIDVTTPLRLQFDRITPIGYKETACISVDHPEQLYITDNYIVTHNTFISIYSIAKLNQRTLILVLPKYIEKWIEDVHKYMELEDEDIYVVRGSESLIELMNMENIQYKFIICAMRTMINYVKSYEEEEDFLFPVLPQNLIRHLKVGVMLNDESHQEFHALFKCCMYFDPPKLIGMTATIETKDKVQDKMYKTLFPMETRISNLVEYKKYVDVIATSYRVNSLRGIRSRRPQGYSHVLFEQTLMRNGLMLKEYLDMIFYYVKKDYIDRRKPGQKMIIFAATVDFCTIMVNRLKQLYPKLDVKRYVEEDSYENIQTADICGTTVISKKINKY